MTPADVRAFPAVAGGSVTNRMPSNGSVRAGGDLRRSDEKARGPRDAGTSPDVARGPLITQSPTNGNVQEAENASASPAVVEGPLTTRPPSDGNAHLGVSEGENDESSTRTRGPRYPLFTKSSDLNMEEQWRRWLLQDIPEEDMKRRFGASWVPIGTPAKVDAAGAVPKADTSKTGPSGSAGGWRPSTDEDAEVGEVIETTLQGPHLEPKSHVQGRKERTWCSDEKESMSYLACFGTAMASAPQSIGAAALPARDLDGWKQVGITIDSGAAESGADPAAFPGYSVKRDERPVFIRVPRGNPLRTSESSPWHLSRGRGHCEV